MQSIVKPNLTTAQAVAACAPFKSSYFDFASVIPRWRHGAATPHIRLGYTHASVSNVPIAHHLVCLTLICSSPSPRGRLERLWDLEMEAARDALFRKSSKTSPLSSPTSHKHPNGDDECPCTPTCSWTPIRSQKVNLTFTELLTALCFSPDWVTCCSPTRWLTGKQKHNLIHKSGYILQFNENLNWTSPLQPYVQAFQTWWHQDSGGQKGHVTNSWDIGDKLRFIWRKFHPKEEDL